MKVKLAVLFTLVALLATASFAVEIEIFNSGANSASIGTALPVGFVPAFGIGPGGNVGGWDQGPFNFVLPVPGDLRIEIQDCCLVGDVYDPVLNGFDLGSTTAVPYAGPTLSTGSWFYALVPSGNYSLNVGDQLLTYIGFPDPYGGGGPVDPAYSPAGFSMQVYYSPTPEPGTMLMLGSGIVGLAGVLRRKLML